MKTRRPFQALALLALVGGCAQPVDPPGLTTDTPPDQHPTTATALPGCAARQPGNRYSVCGQLSGSRFESPTDGLRASTLDASGRASSRSPGTFDHIFTSIFNLTGTACSLAGVPAFRRPTTRRPAPVQHRRAASPRRDRAIGAPAHRRRT